MPTANSPRLQTEAKRSSEERINDHIGWKDQFFHNQRRYRKKTPLQIGKWLLLHTCIQAEPGKKPISVGGVNFRDSQS
jgi:hypothetical protein